MSDTVKKVTKIINIVVIIGLCIGAFFVYRIISEGNSKSERINRMMGMYSDGKWQACLDEYPKLIEAYPDLKGKYEEQISGCYQGMAQEKYAKSMTLPLLERPKAAAEICPLFEKAAGIYKLSQLSVENYCDSLMDMGNFDKAAQVMKDAEARSDIDAAKLAIYKGRLQKKK